MSKDTLKVLEQDIVDFFNEKLGQFTIPLTINFYFQGNKELKQLIKMYKIPDQYSIAINKDFLVQVNEEYFDNFDDETKNILF